MTRLPHSGGESSPPRYIVSGVHRLECAQAHSSNSRLTPSRFEMGPPGFILLYSVAGTTSQIRRLRYYVSGSAPICDAFLATFRAWLDGLDLADVLALDGHGNLLEEKRRPRVRNKNSEWRCCLGLHFRQRNSTFKSYFAGKINKLSF